MVELMVNGYKHILLSKRDNCLICDTPYDKMRFRWRAFHGEAASSCCGAVYQLKDFYIENPTDEQKQLLQLLASGDYIEFAIGDTWIQPLREAIEKIGIKDINNDDVHQLALTLHSEELSKEAMNGLSILR